MTSEYLFGIGTFIVFALIAILYLRRNEKDLTNRTPDSILNEVEVLMAYGKKEDAVRLLKIAKTKFPENTAIDNRLTELE